LKVVTRKSPKVGFVSLGCPKALVDSERILTRLRAEGYEVAASYRAADLVVVNTCGFIDAAVDESLDAIGEALAENGKVIVTGCLGAQPQKILDRHPQVLKITGPQRYEEVVASVHEHLPPKHEPFLDLIPAQGVKLTPRHYAYLKISEGCNHRCSFCIIPSMRGRLVSRPIGEVLREAEQLVRAGVKEILVISQDTSAYGVDLKYAAQPWRNAERSARFYDLAAALGELGVWIRLHYVYPYPHVDKVIELMADGRVLPYLDIPFQHASARILKLMKRPAAAENTLERIAEWRRAVPDMTIRSTFIVGFPGETEETVRDTIDFIDRSGTEFFNVKIFYYDHTTPIHQQAPAYDLKGQGMSWTHRTMSSAQAFSLSEELLRSVRHAPYIAQHSGEIWEIAHFHERGFSPAQIHTLYKNFTRMIREELTTNGASAPVKKELFQELTSFC